MKKLFVALTFMLYAGLTAQTFDFTCSGAQGTWSHTAEDFTVGNLIYNTTVIGDEIDYGKFTLSEDGSQYRVETNGDVRLYPREGESYSVGDHVILKERNIEEGGLIWIGRIDRRFDIDDNRDGWYIEIIQNTNPGISANVDVSIGTIGKIADPTQRGWNHTPGDVEVQGDGFTTIYNTTVIGDEFTMPYEAGRASNNYPEGTLVWSNSNPVYLGTGENLGVSNGSYFIVKYEDDKYLIIQGYQISSNGRIGVQRIVYNTGLSTLIGVFGNFANDERHFTVGRIAAPTITDTDFTHTPGIVTVDGYEYNTATTVADEDRFDTGSTDPGTWRIAITSTEGEVVQLVVEAGAGYDKGEFVVIKQQDATDVDDLLIGEIVSTQSASQVIFHNVKVLHSSYELIEEQSIQVGEIADPTPPFTYDHVGEAEYRAGDYAFDTRVSATDQFDLNRIAQAHAAGANSANTLRNRWAVGLHMDSADFWVNQDKGYNNDDFIIIKDAENNVSIGRLWGKGLELGLHSFRFEVIHGNFDTDDITGGVITIGKLADPIDFPVNLRVEIAQPYASDFSAVENVTVQSDSQSNDPGVNTGILLNTQIDINAVGVSHAFEENHPVSWFDDATAINLWPRNNSDTPNTQATRTEFTFSPPTSPVDGETYTYKYFARDGGYDIANAHLRGLPFHFELDNDIPIQGISLTSASSINTTLDFILITLNRTSDSNLVNVGDKVLIVYGDFLMEGTVHDKPSNGFIEVRRVRGHAYNGFGDIHTRGVSPKLYKLK